MTSYQVLLPMAMFLIGYTSILVFIKTVVKGISERWFNMLFNAGIFCGAVLWVYLVSLHNGV
ncbi:hypothetical protein [Alkalihalobacillus sp. AL-G]|uniref:hypothetical protein n=1 Tax=Alkalihalobacillus sp. AL-G TaxID=2926399 RepID=UPI00272C900A|nr:hypothetical protein [Alkalihalobacillus sp. AL-G]WLD92467.1 hypothetical protein MOJ78_15820 [Alkalihalobacillus sp. AL-G]